MANKDVSAVGGRLPAGWTIPQEPLIAGFGWADAIERRLGWGRVSYADGIILREEPPADQPTSAHEGVLGWLPPGAIVRVTGGRHDGYLPLLASASDLRRRAGVPASDLPDFRYTLIRTGLNSGDANQLQPGRQFTVDWRVRNNGSRVWEADLKLVYAPVELPETANHARSHMSGKPAYTLEALCGQATVAPGETVTLSLTLIAPHEPGWYATHWQLQSAPGVSIGRPFWLRIRVLRAGSRPDPKRQQRFQPGMNINPEPDVHPPDVERLSRLHWVRLVYKAAAKQRSVDEAFNDQYRSLIQNYANAGVKCLLILNPETFWGNAPWYHGGWRTYARRFARVAGRVASFCAIFGDQVAFQIWNEQDGLASNPSAIAVSPGNFAPILGETARAIRAANPDATIVLGGMNSGPEKTVAYLREVEQALSRPLPVDALAYHPYGCYVKHDPFYGRNYGKLGDVLETITTAYPNLPLWITEVGIAANEPIGPARYPGIATYMREVVTEVAHHHAERVPVLIWFAWSDGMVNAGITTHDGTMKPHIEEVFKLFVALGEDETGASTDGVPLLVDAPPNAAAELLFFSSTLPTHSAVPAGSEFVCRWRFRNVGNAVWGEDHQLVYAPDGDNADRFATQTTFAWDEICTPTTVEPGTEGEVQLSLRAPGSAGRHYRGRWEMRDPAGNVFGACQVGITVVPVPEVGTGRQRVAMTFVADHTVPDGSQYEEGAAFMKQWRVLNSGVQHWSNGFRLVFVEGDLQMAHGLPAHMTPDAGREEEVILSVPMLAPPAIAGQPTGYRSLWRMQDDRGQLFGDPLWARIESLPRGGATPLGWLDDPTGWFSQWDPHWASHIVGHGEETIGEWGSLLTCFAMILHALGLRLDPGALNQRLKALGEEAFIGSDVTFAAPTLLAPGLQMVGNYRSWPEPALPYTSWIEGDPLQRIDGALANGNFILAQVDNNPANGSYDNMAEQHWLLLVRRTLAGDDYLMLDPSLTPQKTAEQPLSLMRKYGHILPARSHEDALRDAVKSALIYRYVGGPVG